MKDAKASNWVLERAMALPSGFKLLGTSKGYTSLAGLLRPVTTCSTPPTMRLATQAGWATYNGKDIINRSPTATLVNNVYTHGSPSKLTSRGTVEVAYIQRRRIQHLVEGVSSI